MKAIKINHDVRKMLKEYDKVGTTYDGVITRLIHDVSDYMPLIECNDIPVNINVHEDTMDKIKAYRLSTGESYENILIRMLLIAQTLNNSDD